MPEDKLRMAHEFDEPAPQPGEQKPAEKAEAQTWVREIDVGGRKQRFEADTYESLIDKLVSAQENATRKLQELSQSPKRREPEKRSSDWAELQPTSIKTEDLVTLQSNPGEMFRRMFQAETGLSPEEFRMRENERRRSESEMRAQNDFVRRHPDYNPVPDNAQKIYHFLETQDLPISKRNLDYAYEELRGELVPKSATQSVAAPSIEPDRPAPPQTQSSAPPTFLRPSLGGRAQTDTSGGIDAAEVARIAQLSPGDMKARIEQLFRQSRSAR